MCPNSPPGPVLLQLMLLFYLRLASPPLAFDVGGCKVRSFAYFFFFSLCFSMCLLMTLCHRDAALWVHLRRAVTFDRPLAVALGAGIALMCRSPWFIFFGSFPSYAKLNFADVFLRVICASSPSANGPELRGVHPRVFCLLHFAGKCARNRIFYTVIRFYIVLYHIIQYYTSQIRLLYIPKYVCIRFFWYYMLSLKNKKNKIIVIAWTKYIVFCNSALVDVTKGTNRHPHSLHKN